MKNKWIKLAGAVAAALAVTASVQATPIAGSIGFGGTYTQVGGSHGNLSTATSFNINSVSVLSGTGTFAGAIGLSSLNAPPVQFLSPVLNAATLNSGTLWTVTFGGVTYSMLVTSGTRSLDTTTQVSFTGFGTISDNAGDASVTGSWQLGFGVSGDSFTWQGTSTGNNVPDGGATVMLLGIALSGLGLLKKKLTA